MTRTEFIERYVLRSLYVPADESVAELTEKLSAIAGEAYDAIHASDAKPESGWHSFAETKPSREDADKRGNVRFRPCSTHDDEQGERDFFWNAFFESLGCSGCRWKGLSG